MNEGNDEKIRELLRKAVPPFSHSELERDLWPAMLRRLDERPLRTPWLDWALAALATVWCFLFPEVIPGLLYHL